MFHFSCHDFRCTVVLVQGTHSDNERGEHDPAHLPPYTRLVANHLLDVVVELVHTCETNESVIKIFISNLFQFAAGLPCMMMRIGRWNTCDHDLEAEKHLKPHKHLWIGVMLLAFIFTPNFSHILHTCISPT